MTKDRTYSFRAGDELGGQVEGALAFLRSEPPDEIEVVISYWIRFLFQQDADRTTSAAFRDVLETLGRAWAKRIDDRRWIPEYKAFAEEDEEGPAWLDAVARLTGERWKNDDD